MNNTIKFFIEQNDSEKRLDIFLSERITYLTRSNIKKIINASSVKINKKIVETPAKKLKKNDTITVKLQEFKKEELSPHNLKLDIKFEDNDILIINKPKGMVVHPGAGNKDKTLANALSYKYKRNLSNLNGSLRPGIVHRIDKETSGLLVVAKNNLSHANLGKQFKEHSIERKYICLCWGVVRPMNGKIETLICRDKKNRQLMTVSEIRGKKAITNYKTLKVYQCKNIPKISLIQCELGTGRTHQIRVHMKYKGVSLLGDNQYGKKNVKFKKIDEDFLKLLNSLTGQTLHAKSLGFYHPKTNNFMRFESKLPNDFKKMLDLLSKLSS